MSDLVAWMADNAAMWVGVAMFAVGLIVGGVLLIRGRRNG